MADYDRTKNPRFIFVQNKESREYHLIPSDFIDMKCVPKYPSICKGITSKIDVITYNGCYTEESARTTAANLQNKGREVCGVCVSSLYKTEIDRLKKW